MGWRQFCQWCQISRIGTYSVDLPRRKGLNAIDATVNVIESGLETLRSHTVCFGRVTGQKVDHNYCTTALSEIFRHVFTIVLYKILVLLWVLQNRDCKTQIIINKQYHSVFLQYSMYYEVSMQSNMNEEFFDTCWFGLCCWTYFWLTFSSLWFIS